MRSPPLKDQIMNSDKWVFIMLAVMFFSFASCEAVREYSRAQVDIAESNCAPDVLNREGNE